MREISFCNGYHLGDNVNHIHYLRKLCENYGDIRFFYYIKSSYFDELNVFIEDLKEQIILKKLEDRPLDSINAWVGSIPINGGKSGGVFLLNDRYKLFYDTISANIGLENPIKTSYDMILDAPCINLANTIGNYDILLINSVPLSGQYSLNDTDFKNKVDEWKEKYTIITTRKIDSFPCTLDYKYNLVQIANMSIRVKYIVGIATAPIIPCFNVWNIDSVKKWFVLSKRSTYSYNNRILRESSVANVRLD